MHHTSTVYPVEKVITDAGEDVTQTVLLKDGEYLDFFGKGSYQGITRRHHIEIVLDDKILKEKQPVLVASGWVRPTDSSINVAISQGNQEPPQGIQLEVQQQDGSWKLVKENLGFPAGKTKTVLIDLADVFSDDDLPRIRLSTNLEIYWDQIGWATKSAAVIQTQLISLEAADLTYRGFSRVTAADASSPEMPDYQQFAGTNAHWRDLAGYYTRFGSVDELLGDVDDRYVIMNAGDEMRFRFKALEQPKDGLQRDFILIGDGWVKDGDYNTAFSKTVLPLPSHDSPDYTTPPSGLKNDPVYQKNPGDWQTFHTRYIAPDRFLRSLTPAAP